MMIQYDEELIKAFFDALEREQVSQCEEILAQLRLLSQTRPLYIPWCDYLAGILIEVRDRDWAKSEHIYRDLLQREIESRLKGRVLLGLGLVLEYQGRWPEAIEAHKNSLPIFAELNQPLDQAKAWKNMASAYEGGFAQGDLGLEGLIHGENCCQQTLNILKTSLDPWLEATTQDILGLIYKHLQRWDEAIQCHQRSLTLASELDDTFGIGIAYGNLGEIYQLQDPSNWPKALVAYQKAQDIFQQFGNIYHEAEALTNLASLHHDMGDLTAALSCYEQAIQLIESLRGGLSTETSRTGYFATIAHTYANAILLCLEIGDVGRAFGLVEQARSRAFLDILVERSTRSELSQKVEATTLTLTEVQAALPANTLLLEYFTTGLVEVREGQATSQKNQRHRFPPDQILLFAVTQNHTQFYTIDLSPNVLRPTRLSNAVEDYFLDLSMRRTLYNKLIAPVAHLLQDKHRLYLAPHGPLHYVPFQALVAPDDDALLREAGPQLVYAPSASLLFLDKAKQQPPASHRCLALGYNGEEEVQLQFAEDEARRVAHLTHGHPLIGSIPKKVDLYQRAHDYRLLHLACHGEFDPESPLDSFLHLGPDEQLSALEIIENLHLRSELVTLSACESGLSRVHRGDELIGLARAFLYAGTQALISTLWRVDDCSSLILMQKLYQEVQAGAGFAEALKRAQLYLKHLTRQEVLSVLASIVVDEGEDQATYSSIIDPALLQANPFLVGISRRGRQEPVQRSPDEEENEKIFADPYYWAAYSLFGPYNV